MHIGLFHMSQQDKFLEEHYLAPQYVYHFVRTPISRLGFLYGIHQLSNVDVQPSLTDIHNFLTELFVKALLSAECSIGIVYN